MTPNQKILSEIKTAGYKLTPQRQAIIEAMVSTGAPVTPLALHALLVKKHANIGLVTIYRTIELLEKLGLLCRFTDGTAASFKTGPEHHHHHLVCRGCGDVVDFSGHCPLELETVLERETGFQITDHKIEFSGICLDCQRRSDSG